MTGAGNLDDLSLRDPLGERFHIGRANHAARIRIAPDQQHLGGDTLGIGQAIDTIVCERIVAQFHKDAPRGSLHGFGVAMSLAQAPLGERIGQQFANVHIVVFDDFLKLHYWSLRSRQQRSGMTIQALRAISRP